jgi:hypothetical protein
LAVGIALSATPARATLIGIGITTNETFLDPFNTPKGPSIGHLKFSGATLGAIHPNQKLSLGLFDLGNGTFDYTSYAFQLLVTFRTSTGTFVSPIFGDVTGKIAGNKGNVQINFSSPLHFTDGSESFDLTFDDLTLNTHLNRGVGTVFATLSNIVTTSDTATTGTPERGGVPPGVPSAVPEPPAIMLLGTVVTGLSMHLRKRTLGSRQE